MSAATATAASGGSEHAGLLETYRDNGPIAAAIGHLMGRAVALPAVALLAIAALPGLVAIVLSGEDASRGVVLATVVWAVVAGGISSSRPLTDGLRWMVPPALRAIEFGGLLWIGAVAGPSSLPAVFALLCAIAYHHYDVVYGQRHRGIEPARWVQAVAGGWDGRLLAAAVLLLAGALPAGFFVAAAVLVVLFVGESVVEWRRVGPAPPPGDEDGAFADEEEEAG